MNFSRTFYLISNHRFAELANSVRVKFKIAFMEDSVVASVSRRKGECRQCGYCCKGCVHLVGSLCDTYDNRRKACQLGPVDETDMKVSHSKYCGYKWL